MATAELRGAETGLRALDAIADDPSLARYHLLHSARAEMLRRLGRGADASRELEAALALAPTEPVRRFLMRRLSELSPAGGSVETGNLRPSRG